MTERLTRDARYVEVTDEYVPSGTDARHPLETFSLDVKTLSRGNSGREYKEVSRCVT